MQDIFVSKEKFNVQQAEQYFHFVRMKDSDTEKKYTTFCILTYFTLER